MPKCNVIHEHAKFHLRMQQAGENAKLSLELQLKADLALENCIDRVRNSEMVNKQNEVVKGVDHVSHRGR